MKEQTKKLGKNARLTIAGVGLQILGNLCFALATVGVIKELRNKMKDEKHREIRE